MKRRGRSKAGTRRKKEMEALRLADKVSLPSFPPYITNRLGMENPLFGSNETPGARNFQSMEGVIELSGPRIQVHSHFSSSLGLGTAMTIRRKARGFYEQENGVRLGVEG